MLYGLILLLLFAACGEDKPQPLSIQVVPAKLLGDTKGSEYANWDTVEFTGGGGVTYLVASEPLLTEWNIVACRIADGGSQTKIVAARLNASRLSSLEATVRGLSNRILALEVRLRLRRHFAASNETAGAAGSGSEQSGVCDLTEGWQRQSPGGGIASSADKSARIFQT